MHLGQASNYLIQIYVHFEVIIYYKTNFTAALLLYAQFIVFLHSFYALCSHYLTLVTLVIILNIWENSKSDKNSVMFGNIESHGIVTKDHKIKIRKIWVINVLKLARLLFYVYNTLCYMICTCLQIANSNVCLFWGDDMELANFSTLDYCFIPRSCSFFTILGSV